MNTFGWKYNNAGQVAEHENIPNDMRTGYTYSTTGRLLLSETSDRTSDGLLLANEYISDLNNNIWEAHLMKHKQLTEYETLARLHEDIMLDKIVSATKDISETVKKYGCTLKIIREWNNEQDKTTSDIRLPLKFGYQCWISCLVIRNGKTIKIPANDGETDYYECASCFTASLVIKYFFHNKLILNSDISEILDLLTFFIDALSKEET